MKNNLILLFVLSAAIAVKAFAQNAGKNRITEKRVSETYHFVKINGEMNVNLVQNNEPGVVVTGSAYQIANTITILRNDTLFVYQTNIRQGETKPDIEINIQDITMLEVSGKSIVYCSGIENKDYIIVKAKDGAEIKMDVKAKKV
jgi:hypothetical protein